MKESKSKSINFDFERSNQPTPHETKKRKSRFAKKFNMSEESDSLGSELGSGRHNEFSINRKSHQGTDRNKVIYK